MESPDDDASTRPHEPRRGSDRRAWQSVAWKRGLSGAALLAVSLWLAGCCGSKDIVYLEPAIPPPPSPEAADLPSPVRVEGQQTLAEMRNVDMRIDGAISLRIRYLRGTMASKRAGEPVDLGDKASFVIDIHDAQAGLTTRDLSALLNRYTFAYPDAPLRNLWVTTEGGQVIQEGIMHKVIDIPFTIVADISATPDGKIRLHPTSIRICDIPGGGVLKVLDVQLDEVLDLSGAQGVTVEGNDLLLDPNHLVPSPSMRGRVTAVDVVGNEIVLTFGSHDDLSRTVEHLRRPDASATNYLFIRGGTVRFGKLFMVDADLQIVDQAQDDPLDFYLDRYAEQLAAGYVLPQIDLGLLAYVPDFQHIGSGHSSDDAVAPADSTAETPAP